MKQFEDDYSGWLQDKRLRKAPKDLADQVMDAIAEESRSNALFLTFWQITKVAVFVAAAVLGVGRYGFLILCLLL